MSTKNNEVKITRNTTVEQLKEILNANYKTVAKKDKALGESIAYAAKQMKYNPKQVKKSDLVELAKQVVALLGDSVKTSVTPLKPVVENSVKGTTLKKSDKTEKTSKTQKETQKEETQKEEPKKPVKKPPVPEVVGAESFPDTLKVGDTEYTIAHDIKTMKDLLDVFNSDEDVDIVFAFYWNKSQIKQFQYGGGQFNAPKEFPDNLDLASTLHVSDECVVTYALSMYTEALYQIAPDSFEEIDGVRYNNGIEYQIYCQS